MDTLKTCYILKRNRIMSQFTFFKRKRDEPFDTFYTDEKELIKYCQFKDVEKQITCIQIVFKIK